jgi:urate oxidase
MIALAENRYGKSRVRLVKVKRHVDRDDFREWTLGILLRGDFAACFVDGDNSKILPTDTMKNTVYSLARDSSAQCMEEFGKELVEFFLKRNSQISGAEIAISEKRWEQLLTGGKPHPTTFVQTTAELQVAEVSGKRNGMPSIWSGLANLVIMKTAGSEFTGFIKDPLTTLPQSTDRLFGTTVSARWKYSHADVLFVQLHYKIREILLETFANHTSKSVQHTLYAMGKAALEQVREIDEIQLTMPNKHCLLVDLSRFGQDNPNEIFVPVDEPHGYIEARVHRHG